MIRNYTFGLKTLEPLAHSYPGAGQRATNGWPLTLVRRNPVLTSSGVVHVPALSANHVRGRLRRALARDLLKRLDIEPQNYADNDLRKFALDALFRGGVLIANRNRNEDTFLNLDAIRQVRENIPHLSLFGMASPDAWVEGLLRSGDFVALCVETESVLPRLPYEHGILEQASRIVETMWYSRSALGPEIPITYTAERGRSDSHGDARIYDAFQSPLPFGIETIITGVWLLSRWSLVIPHPDLTLPGGYKMADVAKACLSHGVSLLKEDPKFGLRKAAGFGACEIYFDPMDPVEPYIEYVDKRRDDILKYIKEDFPMLFRGNVFQRQQAGEAQDNTPEEEREQTPKGRKGGKRR